MIHKVPTSIKGAVELRLVLVQVWLTANAILLKVLLQVFCTRCLCQREVKKILIIYCMP